MKKSMFVILLAVLVSSFMVSTALACNCGKTNEEDVSLMARQGRADSCGSTEDKVTDNAEEVNNTLCPVSGNPIGSMGEGVSNTYNGKTYKLCCAGCIKPFKENPEKYLSKIKTN